MDIFELSKGALKSALVSGGIMAFLAIATYIIGVGDVFALDFKKLINVGIIALITALVSLIKNFLTNRKGEFAGFIKVE